MHGVSMASEHDEIWIYLSTPPPSIFTRYMRFMSYIYQDSQIRFHSRLDMWDRGIKKRGGYKAHM